MFLLHCVRTRLNTTHEELEARMVWIWIGVFRLIWKDGNEGMNVFLPPYNDWGI